MPVKKQRTKPLPLRLLKKTAESRRWTWLSLGLLFVLVQAICYTAYGIRTGADSAVYVDFARRLLAGEWPEGRMLWYSSYILLLAAVFAAGGGFGWVVILQMLMSGAAAFALWNAVHKLSEDRLSSWLAVAFYLLWIKIHQWHIFIYTESLFTSAAIITFSLLVWAHTYRGYAWATLFVVITFFTRPTGFSFLAAGLLYAVLRSPLPGRLKWAFVGASTATVLLLLNFMLKDFVLVESYARAEVIYPGYRLGLQPPEDVSLPGHEHGSLVRLLLFVWYQPLYFTKLCLLKLGLFFANVKPYFSWLHNGLIVFLLYPIYALAIVGFRYFPQNKAEKYFIMGFIFSQGLTVMLTTIDWDGRFLVPVLPFVFVLSAIGLRYFLRKFDEC